MIQTRYAAACWTCSVEAHEVVAGRPRGWALRLLERLGWRGHHPHDTAQAALRHAVQRHERETGKHAVVFFPPHVERLP